MSTTTSTEKTTTPAAPAEGNGPTAPPAPSAEVAQAALTRKRPAAKKTTGKKTAAKKPAAASAKASSSPRPSVARKRTPAETAALEVARIGYDETGKGRDAKKISQRPTAKEVATARRVLAKMPGDTVLAKLEISESKLRQFVRGDLPIGDLNGGRAGVKALTAGINSHQVWARKAAAIAWGLHREEVAAAKK